MLISQLDCRKEISYAKNVKQFRASCRLGSLSVFLSAEGLDSLVSLHSDQTNHAKSALRHPGHLLLI